MTQDELKELEALKKDKTMLECELEIAKKRIAYDLNGDTGKDIRDVINGKKIVKTPFSVIMRHKIRYYLDIFFRLF